LAKKDKDHVVVLDFDKNTTRYKRFTMPESLKEVNGTDVTASAYLPLDVDADRVYVTISTKKPEGFTKKLPPVAS
jgi:hypothetical protein